MKNDDVKKKPTQKSSLSKQFADPLLVVSIQTGEIIIDRIGDSYLKSL